MDSILASEYLGDLGTSVKGYFNSTISSGPLASVSDFLSLLHPKTSEIMSKRINPFAIFIDIYF
jgi:hypothetical protein